MAQKLLIILGPTASGKSDLAVLLAQKYNGEIISADSRQVYKGLDIGTGKITREEMKGVPHHLLDVANPQERFTVTDWKEQAEKCIADIASRKKLPIICGGTGFYISALINNVTFPYVTVDPAEQKILESKTPEELFAELERLDSRRALQMKTNGDFKNKRRVIRAIFIARQLGAVPPLSNEVRSSEVGPRYETFIIGTSIPDPELKNRIRTRLVRRLDSGMIEEAIRLHDEPPRGIGLSYGRMNELGLEYRYLAEFLQKKLDREQLIEILSTKIWQYARRQKTWFKRDKSIRWFDPTADLDQTKIFQEVQIFVQKSPHQAGPGTE